MWDGGARRRGATPGGGRLLRQADEPHSVLRRGGNRAGDLVVVEGGRGPVVGRLASGFAEEALDAAGREPYEDATGGVAGVVERVHRAAGHVRESARPKGVQLVADAHVDVAGEDVDELVFVG